ncbi:hypothetical protein VUR80DRAFT_3933 [Thermomyces stellatus]
MTSASSRGLLCALELRVDPENNMWTLSGSTPPPLDTVWRAIRRQHIKVKTFARSYHSDKEKIVDAYLVAESVKQATMARNEGRQDEFVIVSGDADLMAAVNVISEDYLVHVWSWKNALARNFVEELRNKNICVHLLDEHLCTVGFCEKNFRIDKEVIHKHCPVVLDFRPKVEEIGEFIEAWRIPGYRYECWLLRTGDAGNDEVIIPAYAHSISYSQLDQLFHEAKDALRAHGLQVLTYGECCNRYFWGQSLEVQLSNDFTEAYVPAEESHGDTGRAGGDDRIDGGAAREVGGGDGAGTQVSDGEWAQVNSRMRSQRVYRKRRDRKSTQRCDWRRWCPNKSECRYYHDEAKLAFFRDYPSRRATKYKLCSCRVCVRPSCTFAHGMEELFCPTCERTGCARYEGLPG